MSNMNEEAPVIRICGAVLGLILFARCKQVSLQSQVRIKSKENVYFVIGRIALADTGGWSPL